MSDCLATWDASDGQAKSLPGAFMFADVSGFTALSEALQERGREGAEILNRIISDVFTSFVSSIRGHGGDVLSFGGDAVLVHFPGSDPLDRAVTAASEMRATLDTPLAIDGLAATTVLSVSIGIHAGEALAVRVDLGQQVALFAVGPTITRTLRAEAAAEAGQILLTHASAEEIAGHWPTESTPSGALVVPSSDPRPPATTAQPASTAAGVDPASLLPPAIQRIAGTIEAQGQHRRAAVGFIRLGRLDEVVADEGPEATHAVLAETFGVLAEECERTGVSMLTADSYPDSVKMLVSAGAPLATEDNDGALIDALQQTVARLPGQDVHVGAHRGLVFAGDLGAPQRREYTLLGDTVNLAARLMQKAALGEVIASSEIIEQTDVARTPLPPFKVKGKQNDILAHRVEAGDHQRAPLDLPLVGRNTEVARLDEIAEQALAGRLQAVEIVAPAGHGKSRLMREVEYRRPELEPFVGKATAYASSTPYGLVRRLLRVLLKIPRQLPSIEAGRWLADLVENVAPDLAPELPYLAQALDARVPIEGSVLTEPAALQRRVARATADLVGRVRTEPMLVVVDDAQWLDNASRQVLHRIAMDNTTRPWLFLTASRPDDEPFFEGLLSRTELVLEPLEDSQARDLVRIAAGEKPLFDSDVDRVVEQAGGNCLFLVEYARAPAADIPADVESLIARRLDALDPESRRLLGIAAVVGTHPSLEVAGRASHVVDGSHPDDGDWAELQAYLEPVQRGVVTWRDHVFREAVYASLPFQRRRDLHRAVFEIIEASPSDGSRARVVALATHADLGAMAGEAWELLRKTGEEAAAEGASVEAVDLLSRAIVWGDELGNEVRDDERREVLHGLARASDLAGRFTDGVKALTRALELDPDVTEAIKLLALRCRLHIQLGEPAAAEQDLAIADSHLGDAAPADVRVDVLMGHAVLEFRRDNLDAAFEHVRSVVTLDPSEVPPTVRARAFLVGDAIVASGHTANWMVGRGLPIFDLLGDDQGVGASHTNIGNVAYREGDWDRALSHWEQSATAHELAGSLVDLATSRVNIAEMHADRGAWAEAVEEMRDARQTWRACNYRIGLGFVTSLIGRSLARLGRVDEAIEELSEGHDILAAAGASELATEAALRHAEALWLLGDTGNARSRLQDATDHGISEDLASFAALLDGALLIADDAEEASTRLLTALHTAGDAKRWFDYLMAHVLLASANGRSAGDSVDVAALAKRLGVWRVATPDGEVVLGAQPAGVGADVTA